MTTTQTGGLLIALIGGFSGIVSCASKSGATYSSGFRPNGVVRSPSGDFRLIHDGGDDGVPAAYRLYDKDGKQLGNTRSIVTHSMVATESSPTVRQTVIWSASEKTVVIHEDMSGDFPEHSYQLIQRNGSGTYDSRAIQLAPRAGAPPEWPSIETTNDSRLKLRWKSEPKSEYIPLPAPQD